MDSTGDRRPIAARGLRPVVAAADWLVSRGASPNGISLAGMAAALGAGLVFAQAGAWPGPLPWLRGALLVQARLMANLLDGMVALGRGVASPVGELFNEVPDRVSDTAVLAGLGWAAGQPALGLLAALAAMATAYIRAVGRGLGLPSDFSGPMAKQQRMAVATAMALACAIAPSWAGTVLVWGLWAITALSFGTAARRLAHVARALRQ